MAKINLAREITSSRCHSLDWYWFDCLLGLRADVIPPVRLTSFENFSTLGSKSVALLKLGPLLSIPSWQLLETRAEIKLADRGNLLTRDFSTFGLCEVILPELSLWHLIQSVGCLLMLRTEKVSQLIKVDLKIGWPNVWTEDFNY